jgi:hypothetical protein
MLRFDASSLETVQQGWVQNNPAMLGELDPAIFDQLAEKVFLRRFRQGSENTNERYYFDGSGFYCSVTTFTGKSQKASDVVEGAYDVLGVWRENLDKLDWRYGLGVSSNNVLRASATYGTFFHQYVSEYVQGKIAVYSANEKGSLDWKNRIAAAFLGAGYSKSDFETYRSWIWNDFQNDMYAFLTWLEEYKVTVVATDIPVKSEQYRVASVVDIICWMDTKPQNKGKKDRKLVVLDFKTSASNAVYKEHKKQVCTYLYLLQTTYPNLPIEAAYIWKPQERMSGKYKCEDCTDAFTTRQIEAELNLICAYGWDAPKGTVVEFVGTERVERTYPEWLKDQFEELQPLV